MSSSEIQNLFLKVELKGCADGQDVDCGSCLPLWPSVSQKAGEEPFRIFFPA